MIVSVTIENTSTGILGRGGAAEFPPPFHLEVLRPGERTTVAVPFEQLKAQWPHGSGFTVMDLMRQLVQRALISFEVEMPRKVEVPLTAARPTPAPEEKLPEPVLDDASTLEPLYQQEAKVDRRPRVATVPTGSTQAVSPGRSGWSWKKPG